MELILAKENSDGSAVFTIEMTSEETRAFVLLGIKTAILAGIESAKDWDGTADLQEDKAGLSD
jgi:hypothetical protein